MLLYIRQVPQADSSLLFVSLFTTFAVVLWSSLVILFPEHLEEIRFFCFLGPSLMQWLLALFNKVQMHDRLFRWLIWEFIISSVWVCLRYTLISSPLLAYLLTNTFRNTCSVSFSDPSVKFISLNMLSIISCSFSIWVFTKDEGIIHIYNPKFSLDSW